MVKKGKEAKKTNWLILMVIFLIIFIIGCVILLHQVNQRKKVSASYDALKEQMSEAATEPEETQAAGETETEEYIPSQHEVVIAEKDIDWDFLKEENGDIYAWIYVPDTTVDYPVLQHPTDDSYYLNYNIDGSKGFPGCIYTEATYNAKDFSDANTLVYGHNLKDKTMFSSLHNFEDAELFYDGDHFIYIFTEDKVLVYQIFAAYEFPSVHIMDNYDFSNEYVYADYLDGIRHAGGRVANIREDVPVTTEDRIITLSTCTRDSKTDIRYLVAGVLVETCE